MLITDKIQEVNDTCGVFFCFGLALIRGFRPFCFSALCDQCFLSIEWNLIRLGGAVHGIVTKTIHKTLPESVGPRGWVSMGVQGWG